MPAIPHTKTGKELEVPVKRPLQDPTEQDLNPSAVDTPHLAPAVVCAALDAWASRASRRCRLVPLAGSCVDHL